MDVAAGEGGRQPIRDHEISNFLRVGRQRTIRCGGNGDGFAAEA
jgi:hypothetical protein